MEGYVLPGHVEHSAYCGPEGATVIDVFAPSERTTRALDARNRRATATMRA